jgi:hypothetical protein
MAAKQKFKQGLELWGIELRSNNGGVVTLANSLGIFVHANTADRTYTFPDASGTVALLTDIHAPVTLGTANGLSLSTQTLSLGLASSGVTGALSGTDWNTFNGKQAALNGTGLVRMAGTTVSYDNSTYLTGTKVDSFNTRTGAVTLTSSDVTTALTYTPINKAGDTGIGNLSMGALTATQINGKSNLSNQQAPLNYVYIGSTDDGVTDTVVLLHPAYNGTGITKYLFDGTITFQRGSAGSSNISDNYDVKTSTAYITNTGSIISRNNRNAASLVTCTYNSVLYAAIYVPKTAGRDIYFKGDLLSTLTSPLVLSASSVSNVSVLAQDNTNLGGPLIIDGILFNAFTGANSDGYNIWIGGGGQSSIGENGTTDMGAYNSAMGFEALYSNTTGEQNTAVGYHTLYSNTTGYYNSAMGTQSLYSNTTGYYNSAVGTQALYSNTTGSQNLAMGLQALYSNTTGDYNSAMGFEALYSNTTGYQNSAVGAWSLYSNTTGYYNSAMGEHALYSNTTGYQNLAMGLQALYYNTTGYHNSAIGVNALINITPTAKAITAFADYSGGKVKATSLAHGRSTGNSVIISGTTNYNATYTITVIDADNFYFTATWVSTDGETGWWTLSGYAASNNTALGYNTGLGITTGSGNTILGANVTGLSANLTNNIILANGTGAIKAQHDGTKWTLTGGVRASASIVSTTITTITLASSGATATIDCSLGNTFIINLPTSGTTATIATPINPVSGQTITVIIVQGSSTVTTVSWPASTVIKWASGTTNTSSTLNGISMISMVYNGSYWLAASAKDFA